MALLKKSLTDVTIEGWTFCPTGRPICSRCARSFPSWPRSSPSWRPSERTTSSFWSVKRDQEKQLRQDLRGQPNPSRTTLFLLLAQSALLFLHSCVSPHSPSDGVARIFSPNSFAATGIWTLVSSVAPLLRDINTNNPLSYIGHGK